MIQFWTKALFLLVALAAPAAAQEPTRAQARRISLEEAVRRLEAGNLELRLARAAVATAEARTVGVGVLANPHAIANREQLSGDAGSYHETVFSLGQTLEVGGERGARRRVAAEGVVAAEAALGAQYLRLAYEVHRTYVEAAVAEANQTVLGETTEIFRRVEQAGQARFAAGDISRFDRGRLQIERARYETLLANSGLELSAAARGLAMLVTPDSIANPTLLLPAARLSEIPVISRTIDLSTALAAAAGRAEVRAAGADVAVARAALDLARRERTPDVTLSGGVKEQAGGTRGVVFGVSVPLPLWNRNQGPIAVAQAALDAALARESVALRSAENEIRRAWDVHRSFQARLETIGETLLPQSAGLLETARVAYAEGEMSLLELLDAADAYRSGYEAMNELLGAYLIAIYDLDRATGSLATPGRMSVTDSAQ